MKNFINETNNTLSKSIYSYGLENISETLKNRNLWPKVLAKNQAEKFITSDTYGELFSSLKGVDSQSVAILKDNNGNLVVDDYLNLKSTIPDKHPLKVLQDFVDESLNNAQSDGKFNLGLRLSPLNDPPYGLYPNKLNVAALAFVLRKYVNKLYDGKGNSIDETKMRNLVMAIFEFWSKGKRENDLFIRFGSENEKKLGELINNIFELNLDSNNQSISTVRWKLREWIKLNKTPLWLFKYSEINMKNETLSESLDTLFTFLKPKNNNLPDSIIQECYESIKPVKVDLKLSFKEDPDELFNKFLKGFNKEFTSNNVIKIKEHLINVMPEEVYDWDENKVKTEIYEWLIVDKPAAELKDPNLKASVDGNSIHVSLDKEVSGNILVNVAGNGYYGEIFNGKSIVNINGLERGTTYLAKVSYGGDDNFDKAETIIQMKIELLDPNLEVSVEDSTIYVSLNKEVTGNILVNVNNHKFSSKINNGKSIIKIPGLEGGNTYEATIYFEGDNKFAKSKMSVTLEIESKENDDEIIKIKETDANLLKDALIDALNDNGEITPKIILEYLGRITNGSS